MKHDTVHQQVGRAINEGWGRSGAFAGSILSGALLGLLADSWLGTEPWLAVIGSVLGIYSAFLNVWRWTQEIEEVDGES